LGDIVSFPTHASGTSGHIVTDAKTVLRVASSDVRLDVDSSDDVGVDWKDEGNDG